VQQGPLRLRPRRRKGHRTVPPAVSPGRCHGRRERLPGREPQDQAASRWP
jgi:hypothetical protein